jgi:hypothetical protein
MFPFMAFDSYVVKVVGGHPQGKRRKLKHPTTFGVQQQPLQHMQLLFLLKCGVSVSAFILLYCCHTTDSRNETEASIHEPRMLKSHVQ